MSEWLSIKSWKFWVVMPVGVAAILGVVVGLQALGVVPSPPPHPDEVLAALEVPEPPSVSVPVLSEVAPGIALDSMCVTFQLTGEGGAEMEREFTERSRPTIEDRTADMLRLAGVELVDVGCTAQLTVTVEAGWVGASYQGLGFCATGYDLEGEATFEIGKESSTWTTTHAAGPPPEHVSGPNCRRSNAPIQARWWYEDLVAMPFAELLGSPGEAAAWVTAGLRVEQLAPPDGTALAIAIDGIRGENVEDALALIAAWALQHRSNEQLDTLIPFLIEGFANDPDEGQFHTALARITREQIVDGRITYGWEPGDWYRWWAED